MYKWLLAAITAAVAINAIVETAKDAETSSRLGFKASAWGPHAWIMLHLLALNLPLEFGTAAREFEAYVYALQQVLPCQECRDEFEIVLSIITPRAFLKRGRIGAIAFVYSIHCIVSSRVKAAACTVEFLQSEEQFLREYLKDASEERVQSEMQNLRDSAKETNIQLLIDDALLKWKMHVHEKNMLKKDT